jgi:hypothetical protein
MERIKGIPVPQAYSHHLKQSVILYILSLPFQLVRDYLTEQIQTQAKKIEKISTDGELADCSILLYEDQIPKFDSKIWSSYNSIEQSANSPSVLIFSIFLACVWICSVKFWSLTANSLKMGYFVFERLFRLVGY